MNDFNDLTSRLKALGDNPVPPPVATEHLTAMAAVAKTSGGGLARKIRVAAAFGVGILVGGTGLGYAAAQDALPEPAQNAVEAAGKAVGLEIAAEKKAANAAAKAERQEAKGDKGASAKEVNTADCPGGASFRNHGEYVKSVAQADYATPEEKEAAITAAAESDCGKPLNAGADDGAGTTEDDGEGKANGKGAGKANKPDKVEDDGDDADDNAVEPEQKPETPAGPPADQGNAPEETPPAEVPVSDNADDTASEHTPDGVPPVDPGAATDD